MGLAHVTPRRSIGLSWNVLSLATDPANSGGKFVRNRASPGIYFYFYYPYMGIEARVWFPIFMASSKTKKKRVASGAAVHVFCC